TSTPPTPPTCPPKPATAPGNSAPTTSSPATPAPSTPGPSPSDPHTHDARSHRPGAVVHHKTAGTNTPPDKRSNRDGRTRRAAGRLIGHDHRQAADGPDA